MITGAVENVVRERLGLDPAALGPHVLERAVEVRMRARQLTDSIMYATRLLTEQAERDALASELAVSETWFFRGGHALYERLAAFVADRVAGRSPDNVVRILSVPCSTGEEPYSLAVALHERFLTFRDFSIDAVDLSERALAKAATARYNAFAFREAGSDVRPAYFRQIDDSWELLPHLRAAVHFQPANLTDPTFLVTEPAYDLILCRNLFIYLTADARLRALANIDRLLALDGRLCVTPGEADRLTAGRFVLEGPTEFGIYSRVGMGRGAPTVLATWQNSEAETGFAITPPPAKGLPAPTTLIAARSFADAGRLDEARAACEQLLQVRPSDADALALLGVVHLAAGRPNEAYGALRKALYLAPDHVEAMSHMAGLCEHRGDEARAAALRRRLARATEEAT